MACNKCKGMTKLTGYKLEKCETCGNEQQMEFKTSKMWEIRQAWKKLMHKKI